MTKSERTIAILEIITSVGLLLFWTAFFTIGMAPKNPPPCYFVFEHSFPVPDVILAIGLLAGSIMMLMGRAGGRRLSLLCARGRWSSSVSWTCRLISRTACIQFPLPTC